MAPFGYGQLTGIDISGEKPGLLPSPEWKRQAFKRPQDQVWFPGETVNFGVGQGYLLVTPLQLAHVASVLAERGKSFRPRLVTGVRDIEGKVKAIAPLQLPAIDNVSDAAWDLVLRGHDGSGDLRHRCRDQQGRELPALRARPVQRRCSRSRKAKNYVEKNVAERLRDHAWFIAFAPAEAPRIAVAVLVENGGFGASAAAPIARKVMDAYLLHQKTTSRNGGRDRNARRVAGQ